MAVRPWAPTDAQGVTVLEFDPSSLSTSSGSVGSLASKDGSVTCANATGSAQPTYSATGFNGYPALVFSGAQVLRSTVNIQQGPNWAAFAACTPTQVTGPINVIDGDNIGYGNGNRVAQYLRFDGSQLQSIAFIPPPISVASASVASGAANAPKIIGASLPSRTVQASLNGGTVGTATLTADPISALSTLALGGTAGNGQFFRGAIGYWALVRGILSQADYDRFIGYIAWRFGLAGNLPANHPYKAAAPTVDDGAATDSRIGSGVESAKASATGSGAKSGRGAGACAARATGIGSGSKASVRSSAASAVAASSGTGSKAASGAGLVSAVSSASGSGQRASQAIGSAAGAGRTSGSGAVARFGTGSDAASSVALGAGSTARRSTGVVSARGVALGTGVAAQASEGSSAARATGTAVGSGARSARGLSASTAAAYASGVGCRSLSGSGRATAAGLAIAAGCKGSVGIAALIATGRASGFNRNNAHVQQPIQLQGRRTAPVSLKGTRQAPVRLRGTF